MQKEISDHKIIGRNLQLFTFTKSTPGFCFWHPKGVILYDLIVNYLRGLLADLDYQEIKTPIIFNANLWKKSGHFDNYKDKMYFCGDNLELAKIKNDDDLGWGVKPMNCPESMLVFNEYVRTYKDLPIRFSDFGILHRYEQAGEVNGLFRAREFAQDDAHIYCTFDQIEKEIEDLMELISKVYQKFGFDHFEIELSTMPEKHIGENEQWEKAEEVLKDILKKKNIKFKDSKGEGAFYGPKIDFHVQDSLDRSWQLGTIQLDLISAKKLDVNFINKDGKKENPILIHRAILGSIERFIAILLENTGGALPAWLSPVQAIILPITERNNKYAHKILEEMKVEKLRVEVDESNESLSKKIRNAQVQKIPYIVVVGDKEEKVGKIAVRDREKGDLGQMELKKFVNLIEIK
jgi:threonyl-tRNA synthetase